jgi:hypothetical protein
MAASQPLRWWAMRDGAHHVSAEVYQALNDVGFTIPANAVAY